MQNKNIKTYIFAHKDLFWYTPADKLNDISPSFLLETILNYGTMKDVQELLDIIGKKEAATIFNQATQNSTRSNYFPDVEHYFTLYFKKYVS